MLALVPGVCTYTTETAHTCGRFLLDNDTDRLAAT
jgi:hypothetical protein